MYKRILVPLDGSTLAEQALPHAVAQAERFEAELVLLQVLEVVVGAPGIWQPTVKQTEAKMKVLAQEYLERVAASVRERGVPVQTKTIEGRPHTKIAEYAEANQVDLIVMCARGQSGLSRWLMGSVADRVVRGADVPVLLVRARKKKA
jgi:nucleotide-binding universal stress UspA family protein